MAVSIKDGRLRGLLRSLDVMSMVMECFMFILREIVLSLLDRLKLCM
jgi:hypothetical protein